MSKAQDLSPQAARELDWSTSDIPSLAGKVALVTGGNSLSSIGGNIVHQLALKGAKVYIGARTASKAEAAIKDLAAQSPSIPADNLKPFVADIGADLPAVKAAAEKFLQEEDRLDILVNNAGIFPLHFEYNSFGLNSVMATNHLGHFLLTTTLLPLLEKTAKADPKSDVRIVNLSSSSVKDAPPTASFASLEAWNDEFGGEGNGQRFVQRYAYSKVANLLFTKELQQRVDQSGAGIVVTAVDPGRIQTPGLSKLFGADNEVYQTSWTALEGALTPLWAAVHPEVREKASVYGGRFIAPFGVVKEWPTWDENEAESKNLWRVSESLLETHVSK